MKKLYFNLILFILNFYCILNFISFTAYSQTIKSPGIAILDLTARNSESDKSNLFSAEHICKTMGIPYLITSDVSAASGYAVILASSGFKNTTFSTPDKNLIINYVNNGGTLITNSITGSNYYSLCGISNYSYSTKHHTLNWVDQSNDLALKWINDSLEKSISLGDPELDNVIGTYSYTLNTGIPLAFYDDKSVAVVRNFFGAGFVYTLGLEFYNIILRNQLNMDYDAQRTWGEGFEPTSDVIMLFVKGVLAKHVPYLTWKNSAPYNYSSAFMMTHDIDCQSAMDTMKYFAEYESLHNLKTMYLITTHYMRDWNDADYYTPNISKINYVLSLGQVISSHSVGHFEDFYSTAAFPIGSPGNTKQNYSPTYNGTKTTGGTVFGECEVSKNLLLSDVPGSSIKTFRSGYLDFNDNQIQVEDSLGYLYNTTQSANDVLTHFPYHQHKIQDWNGKLSNIYEIPLTIDADPITKNNWRSLALYHLQLINKIKDNNAVTVILIHPTYLTWKLQYEQYLFSNLPPDVYIMNLEDFGDFWKYRENFSYTSAVSDNNLTITIPASIVSTSDFLRQSIIVNNGRALQNISVVTTDGNPVTFYKSNCINSSGLISDNDIVIYFSNPVVHPLTISSNPVSQTLCEEQPVSFSVSLLGTMPYSYQWKKGNNIIPGATDFKYTINSLTKNDAGKYNCIVKNPYSQLTSDTASFAVKMSPHQKIFAINSSEFTFGSDSAIFYCPDDSVLLSNNLSSDKLSWQWKVNGVNISNGTNFNYEVKKPGQYILYATNSIGCTGYSNSLDIMINPLAHPHISYLLANPCNDSTINLSASYSAIENFESGDFKFYPWSLEGNQLWKTTNLLSYEGSFSARSGAITNSQSSYISVFSHVPANDTVSFFYKVSSEVNYDFLSFYINDSLVAQWSGEVNWSQFLYPLTKGDYVFKWVYSKDISVSKGSDAAWLDLIRLPDPLVSDNMTQVSGYQWKLNGNNIAGATNSIFKAENRGSYNVSLSGNCGNFNSPPVYINIPAEHSPIITSDGSTNLCSTKSVSLNASLNNSESFESGNFSRFNWLFNGNADWVINSSTVYDQHFSAKSGTITHSQNSELLMTAFLSQPDSISFCFKVSSELKFDFLSFYINNLKIGAWSGEVGWSRVSFPVPAGRVIFTWEYAKDRSVSKGSDAAFIDNIILPNIFGTGRFKYQWQQNGSDIPAATYFKYSTSQPGSYNLLVSDSCSSRSSNIINVDRYPEPAVITAQGSANICSGSSVNLFISNFSLDRTYQWQLNGNDISAATAGSFSANSSGNYSAYITNFNGCPNTSNNIQVNVFAYPAVNISASGNTAFCNTGSVVLSCNSQPAGSAFQWRKNSVIISGSSKSSCNANAEGSYDLIVTNSAKCSTTSQVITILFNTAPTATVTPQGPTTFCSGGSVLLKCNTGSGYSYQWRFNGSNISGATSYSYSANTTGNYSVIIKNANACSTTSSSVTVSINSSPVVTVTPAGPVNLSPGGSVTLKVYSNNGISYQWLMNGSKITGVTKTSFVVRNSGIFLANATNNKGCVGSSNSVKVTVNAARIESDSIETSPSISYNYPNPFSDYTQFDYFIPSASYVILKVYNLLGQDIKTLVNTYQDNGDYKVILKADNLSKGAYLYKFVVKSNNSEFSRSRLMIKN